MATNPSRPVGDADFHDGRVISLVQIGSELRITVEASSGKRFEVHFEGVTSTQRESPEGMMLYAFNEEGDESESLKRYEFVNWYVDERSDQRAKAHLRIIAKGFKVTPLD